MLVFSASTSFIAVSCAVEVLIPLIGSIAGGTSAARAPPMGISNSATAAATEQILAIIVKHWRWIERKTCEQYRAIRCPIGHTRLLPSFILTCSAEPTAWLIGSQLKM